jgi:hypothetical protein
MITVVNSANEAAFQLSSGNESAIVWKCRGTSIDLYESFLKGHHFITPVFYGNSLRVGQQLTLFLKETIPSFPCALLNDIRLNCAFFSRVYSSTVVQVQFLVNNKLLHSSLICDRSIGFHIDCLSDSSCINCIRLVRCYLGPGIEWMPAVLKPSSLSPRDIGFCINSIYALGFSHRRIPRNYNILIPGGTTKGLIHRPAASKNTTSYLLVTLLSYS